MGHKRIFHRVDLASFAEAGECSVGMYHFLLEAQEERRSEVRSLQRFGVLRLHCCHGGPYTFDEFEDRVVSVVARLDKTRQLFIVFYTNGANDNGGYGRYTAV